MRLLRAVLVVKRTALAALGAQRARAAGTSVRRLRAADRRHGETLATVRRGLESRRIPWSEVPGHRIGPADRSRIAAADLVIAVGGDGTVLSASHHVGRGALLGVNSAPGDSVGHFCSACGDDFVEALDAILASRRKPVPVARLRLALRGVDLPVRALNDVLVAHSCPAATTRYQLRIGARAETHRSSGIWISTACGSTAGILSAGGRAMSVRSRRLQYRVRELYREPGRGYALVGSILPEDARVLVESRMPEGRLYVDGARLGFDFPYGSRLVARIDPDPLLLFTPPSS